PVVTFNAMNGGRYELLASNENGVIVHTVFGFNDCLSSSLYVYQDPTNTRSSIQESFGFVYDNDNEDEGSFVDWSLNTSSLEDGETQGRVDLSPQKQPAQAIEGESHSINIFPNPITRGGEVSVQFVDLDELEFTVQVMDNKG